MHRYRTTDGPWCTAHWVELEATTTTEALDDKERKYKHARFLDELPGEQQMEIIDATRDRG
ncbi:hypothetical protein [Streptomyces sp. NPDC088752]|uniref:hypothetical protein n=1 Tax=Streptomyces sp. NPDC088752 TaxID=3154963 RepID=UPI00341438CA